MKRFASKSLCAATLLAVVLSAVMQTGCAGGMRRRGGQAAGPTVLSGSLAGQAQKLGPGDFRRELTFGGDPRFYDLHVPATYTPAKRLPLVLVLHGGGGSPDAVRKITGFNTIADQNGCIVLYPAGTGEKGGDQRLSWNILKSGTYATKAGKDDLGFLRTVLRDVQEGFAVDTKRVFATGISQGGMMCYRMACDADLSARIAAIAPVAAVMTVDPKDCNASRPMPILHFHGLKDEFIPYAGGVGRKLERVDPVARPGVPETMKYWQARNKVGDQARTRSQRGVAEGSNFGREGDPGEIVLWKLGDGGHTWPGGDSGLPEFYIGKVNRDIDASSAIWSFFLRHPLP